MYTCMYVRMYVCSTCMCMLCVALAHMCSVWYNRSAVHLGPGWPNIVAQAGELSRRKPGIYTIYTIPSLSPETTIHR